MPIAKQKYVQSLIQVFKRAIDLEKEADELMQDAKAKFLALGLDLTDTNLTSAQLTAANNHIASLNVLANDAVATFVTNKDHPSHGTKLIEDLP